MRSRLIVASHMTSALVFVSLLATPSFAQNTPELREPYLSTVPRTDAERARIKSVTQPTTDFQAAEGFEGKPAGKATTRVRTDQDAFSQFSDSLSFEQELDFKLGNSLFKKLWVSSPSSTLASDGLGPVFNARSCQRCHLKDGRGHAPNGPQDNRISMFLRLSVPTPDGAPMSEIEAYIAQLDGEDARSRTMPEPTYGGQLQILPSKVLRQKRRWISHTRSKRWPCLMGKQSLCVCRTIR
jgi:CxxC motif-containing protein (DUF1111 family)